MLITLIGIFVLVYFLLERDNPIKKKSSEKKTIFNNPIFKRVTGSAIILFSLAYSIKFVKVLPVYLKIGLIFGNFVIIYLVINYFFNKQKQSKK